MIYQKNAWPRVCKKLKQWEIYTKFFLARNNLKSLKIRLQHHLWSFWWNFRPLTLKKELSDLSKECMKKTQKMRNLYKIFFGSQKPEKLENTSATPFVKFLMNFRPLTLKKELSDLSKNFMTLGMQKNSKKKKFIENFFLARNNLKSFKIRLQHHL